MKIKTIGIYRVRGNAMSCFVNSLALTTLGLLQDDFLFACAP